MREMDPSMLLAFLIRDDRDWQAWKQGVKEVRPPFVLLLDLPTSLTYNIGAWKTRRSRIGHNARLRKPPRNERRRYR